MKAHVRMGDNRHFVLKEAVLLYQDGARTFATLHAVKRGQGGIPYLNAGQLVTMDFLRRLTTGLGASLGAEILPECVLARAPELVVWWSRAQRRLMFFSEHSGEEAKQLNGRIYPHPALVFMLVGRELFVRALERDERPTSDTSLKTAPYWNTDGQGRVCQGNMRPPGGPIMSSLAAWEEAYFAGSEFTHPSGAVQLTSHPGGFLGLWSNLSTGQEHFPTEFLASAKQTLREFVATS